MKKIEKNFTVNCYISESYESQIPWGSSGHSHMLIHGQQKKRPKPLLHQSNKQIKQSIININPFNLLIYHINQLV